MNHYKVFYLKFLEKIALNRNHIEYHLGIFLFSIKLYDYNPSIEYSLVLYYETPNISAGSKSETADIRSYFPDDLTHQTIDTRTKIYHPLPFNSHSKRFTAGRDKRYQNNSLEMQNDPRRIQESEKKDISTSIVFTIVV